MEWQGGYFLEFPNVGGVHYLKWIFSQLRRLPSPLNLFKGEYVRKGLLKETEHFSILIFYVKKIIFSLIWTQLFLYTYLFRKTVSLSSHRNLCAWYVESATRAPSNALSGNRLSSQSKPKIILLVNQSYKWYKLSNLHLFHLFFPSFRSRHLRRSLFFNKVAGLTLA